MDSPTENRGAIFFDGAQESINLAFLKATLTKGLTMTSTLSSAGDIVDARCTKCRKVTNHVIVAMVGTSPNKVQCNTCNGVHQYRSTPPLAKATKQASSSAGIKPEDWADLRNSMNNGLAREYDMDKEYRVGTLIRHSSFGLGLVQRIFGSRKMEVLFEDGRKTMRCK